MVDGRVFWNNQLETLGVRLWLPESELGRSVHSAATDFIYIGKDTYDDFCRNNKEYNSRKDQLLQQGVTLRDGKHVQILEVTILDGLAYQKLNPFSDNNSNMPLAFTGASKQQMQDLDTLWPISQSRDYIQAVGSQVPLHASDKSKGEFAMKNGGIRGLPSLSTPSHYIFSGPFHLLMRLCAGLLVCVSRLLVSQGKLTQMQEHLKLCCKFSTTLIYHDKFGSKMPKTRMNGPAMRKMLKATTPVFDFSQCKHRDLMDSRLAARLTKLLSSLAWIHLALLTTDWLTFAKLCIELPVRSFRYAKQLVALFGKGAITPTLRRLIDLYMEFINLCKKTRLTIGAFSEEPIELRHYYQKLIAEKRSLKGGGRSTAEEGSLAQMATIVTIEEYERQVREDGLNTSKQRVTKARKHNEERRNALFPREERSAEVTDAKSHVPADGLVNSVDAASSISASTPTLAAMDLRSDSPGQHNANSARFSPVSGIHLAVEPIDQDSVPPHVHPDSSAMLQDDDVNEHPDSAPMQEGKLATPDSDGSSSSSTTASATADAAAGEGHANSTQGGIEMAVFPSAADGTPETGAEERPKPVTFQSSKVSVLPEHKGAEPVSNETCIVLSYRNRRIEAWLGNEAKLLVNFDTVRSLSASTKTAVQEMLSSADSGTDSKAERTSNTTNSSNASQYNGSESDDDGDSKKSSRGRCQGRGRGRGRGRGKSSRVNTGRGRTPKSKPRSKSRSRQNVSAFAS